MIYRNSEGYPDPTAGLAINMASRRQYRPLVYICSRYAGDIEDNVRAARKYCRFAVDNGYIPVASHLLYPQFLNDDDSAERDLGLFFGKILMDRCEEVWIFGSELSAGMKAEYERAKCRGYRIRRFSEECEEVSADD
jgi:hypothetical protein